MDLLIWLSAIAVAVGIALVETVRFLPSSLSQAELDRRATKGDKAAQQELTKRSLLPLYYGLQRIKITLLVLALVALLAVVYPLWLALLVSLVLLLAVGVAVAKNWFGWLARWIQPKIEGLMWRGLRTGAPVFSLFAPRVSGAAEATFASKDELRQMVQQDGNVLAADEKARLIAAMHFGGKTVADAMVPRDQIATVGQSETVGPLLLDKLHKMGHNIVVVVSKNLDSVKGLLYMSDLVPLDPEIKTVKDALRPKVFYLSADAPLGDVLAVSLKTGRQLFLVAKGGQTVGLITLADALEHALGGRTSKAASVAAKPEDV